MLRRVLLAAIRAYQRGFSPHKGYACAYRLVHGGNGCSGVGLRLIRRYGALHGLHLLWQRLQHCTVAAVSASRIPPTQRGSCDLGCMGCDLALHTLFASPKKGPIEHRGLRKHMPLMVIGACILAIMGTIVALHWIP